MTTKQRVLAGIQLLNKKVPDWRQKIDINKFDIRDCSQCVLAQIFGTYHLGVYFLNLSPIEIASFGFNCFIEIEWVLQDISGEAASLQETWKKELVGWHF